MLLALFFFPARGEMLGTTALSYAASTSPTTGLRWQQVLTGHGLIERGPSSFPIRRQFLRLTDKGRTLMEEYLTRIFFARGERPLYPERAGG